MRRIVLMRGVPGSGKSTYVRKITSENSIICSADHYFIVDGVYKFDRSKLSEAHAACLHRFVQTIITYTEDPNLCCDVLVVDNTNTTALELAPYVAIAAAYGYKCEVITVECNPYLAHQRNTHDVPLTSVLRMAEWLKDPLPSYWNIRKGTLRSPLT